MKIVKLTLMAIVIAFATTSCSKQIDAPAAPAPATAAEATVTTLPQATAVAATSIAPMVQTPVYYSIDANTGGFLQALPGDYATNTSAKYPLIIFMHGKGELGSGSTTDLPKVANNSIPKLIKYNQFPASFTAGGQTSSFIVISPQFKAWPKATDVDAVLNYALSHYRVDASRIYLVGLSMGGGVTWQGGYSYASKFAAIVPMAGACSLYDPGAQLIAGASLPVWAFHNNADPVVNPNYTYSWVSRINKYHDPIPARQTIFVAATHDCWTKASDPNYRESINGVSVNIYEWMLLHKR